MLPAKEEKEGKDPIPEKAQIQVQQTQQKAVPMKRK